MIEKIYKSMGTVGAINIAIGIVIIVTGVVSGVLSIVGGSRLLKTKNKLTF